jgi:3-oxoacyl-[acyl-carrier protein] reductase
MVKVNLTGKIALVTGASRGIGRAIALELSKAGAFVAVGYRIDDKGAQETLEILKAQGGQGCVICADVSSFTASKVMMEEIINVYGKIDILVNNAGISKIGLLIDMTEEDVSEMIDINLKGTINCSQHALNYMLFHQGGVIINISSIWGEVGASCEAVYSAAKGGINSFTKALAKEAGPSNVRVNAISPGVIDTEMNRWMIEEEKKALIEEIPLGRFGLPEEVGKLAAFLASEAASYINGQIITVDGGFI